MATGELDTAQCFAVIYVYISCTEGSGRPAFNSRFTGSGGWGGKGSKQKICCESVDDDGDGLNVKSVVQMEGGGRSGIITGDSETLGLDNLQSEVVRGACIFLSVRFRTANWKAKCSKRNNRRNSLNLICTEFVYVCNIDLFLMLINFWTL